jgi:hypothetical protein
VISVCPKIEKKKKTSQTVSTQQTQTDPESTNHHQTVQASASFFYRKIYNLASQTASRFASNPTNCQRLDYGPPNYQYL